MTPLASLTSTLALALVPFAPAARQTAHERIGDHTAPIQQLYLSADGKVLVTAANREIHGWSVKQAKSIWKSELYPADQVEIGVGKELVVRDIPAPTFVFLDVETGLRADGIGVLPWGGPYKCFRFGAKDRWVVAISAKGYLVRAEPRNVNATIHRQGDNGGTSVLAVHPKGKLVAVGGVDGSVAFVDGNVGIKFEDKGFAAHVGTVSALAWNPRGSLLVTGSTTGEVRTWKAPKGKRVHDLKLHDGEVQAVAFDPKGKRFAAGDSKGRIVVWDAKSGEPLLTLEQGDGKPVVGLAFVGKGERLASAGGDSKAWLWDLAEL